MSAFKPIAVFGGFGLIAATGAYFFFDAVSVNAHIAILQWVSLVVGVLNGCGFYAIRKNDDLTLNAKLDREKLERLRGKLEPRRRRLVVKWVVSIALCIVAGILSQGLKGGYSNWFDVIGAVCYGALAIALFLLGLIIVEIGALSKLQLDLAREYETKKAQKELLSQIRA